MTWLNCRQQNPGSESRPVELQSTCHQALGLRSFRSEWNWCPLNNLLSIVFSGMGFWSTSDGNDIKTIQHRPTGFTHSQAGSAVKDEDTHRKGQPTSACSQNSGKRLFFRTPFHLNTTANFQQMARKGSQWLPFMGTLGVRTDLGGSWSRSLPGNGYLGEDLRQERWENEVKRG